MKELWNSLIKINYLNEIVSTIIGILIGFFLNIISKNILKGIRTIKRHKFFKQMGKSFECEGMISLDHGDPFYQYNNLVCKCAEDCFYLAIPIQQLTQLRMYNEEFISREDSFFKGMSIDEVGIDMGIRNLKELIDKHRKIVADSFVKRLYAGSTLFNGEMFGVRKIISDRNGIEENAKLIITYYSTDHFTHLVMASIYQELRKAGHEISKIKSIIDTNRYFPFTSSFGVNTMVILEPENAVILAKRSGRLRNMEGKDKWHVSMNEALTITDIDEDIIDFDRCVRRGLREELGIRPSDQSKISESKFGDLFFVEKVFEMGITNIVKIDMSFEELKQKYSTAKDGELETVEIKKIKINKKAISEFWEKNECTQACHYCLEMMIGRGLESF